MQNAKTPEEVLDELEKHITMQSQHLLIMH